MVRRGSYRGLQRWFCKECGKTFSDARPRDTVDRIDALYRQANVTQEGIARQLGVSRRTVVRRLQEFKSCNSMPSGFEVGQQVVLLLDTTYWGRNFGVVIIKDNISGRVVWYKFIEHKERLCDYEEGVNYAKSIGLVILGIVSDGLKGLRNSFKEYRFQLCQFHAGQYVCIKLTNHPKSQAAQELLAISRLMCHTDKEGFVGRFREWEKSWASYLKEKSQNDEGKSFYTHQRLRSAWSSLNRNLEWLWTFYDYPESRLPNTNNAMEGLNSAIKDKMRLHRGISMERRKALIVEILLAHNPMR